MKKQNTIVSIDTVTWSRESNGLFDYESQHVSRRNLKASSSAKIIRIKNDIRLITDMYNEKNVCENSKTLALLKHREGTFTVTKNDDHLNNYNTSESENFWLVVKNIKKAALQNDYMLRENDIVKFGRIKFRVRELHPNGNSNNLNLNDNIEINHDRDSTGCNNRLSEDLPKEHFIRQVPESQELSCRICLNSENTEKNPLISPCACAGSVKHIHLDCLKYWIKSKSHIRSHGLTVSYSWKSLECELCHQPLPEIFIHNDKKIDLIDLPKPQTSYITLETISSKERQTHKVFYVVLATDKDPIKIGRGHDCDIRVGDISVSRFHAFIRYSFGKFYLQDNNSKFGTLALLKSDFVIKPEQSIAIQIGRTVISFTLIPKHQNNMNDIPNLFKALSNLSTSSAKHGMHENIENLDKIQHFFQKKRDTNFKNFIDTLESVQIGDLNTKSSSPYFNAKKDNLLSSSLNSKLFSLTLDKDRDTYSHIRELIESKNEPLYVLRLSIDQSKFKTTGTRARSSEDRVRERKNILNEMKNLNLNEDDDDDEEENDEDMLVKAEEMLIREEDVEGQAFKV